RPCHGRPGVDRTAFSPSTVERSNRIATQRTLKLPCKTGASPKGGDDERTTFRKCASLRRGLNRDNGQRVSTRGFGRECHLNRGGTHAVPVREPANRRCACQI